MSCIIPIRICKQISKSQVRHPLNVPGSHAIFSFTQEISRRKATLN